MRFALPRTLTLPSGARVTLRRTSSAPTTPARREGTSSPLFGEVITLFEARLVTISRGETALDVLSLPLADFHVVRAVLGKAGLVHEAEVELSCHNCDAHLTALPAAGLETGPWEDGELGDPELDRTAELGVALETAPIRLGRVRQVSTVTFAPRTAREAMPLWTALAREPLDLDEDVVRAMGITALGTIRDPARIARALTECDDAAFASVTDAFLDAHYPLRLACDVFCATCGARNTVDAPAEREFERGEERASRSG